MMSPLLTSPRFVLPPELEARRPAELRGLARDEVRLLVTRHGQDAVTSFRDLPRFVSSGDLLVVNNSATLPAAVDALTVHGRELTLHFSTYVSGTLWIVEPRAAIEEPQRLELPGDAVATLIAPVERSATRLWFARIETSESVVEYLHAFGHPIRYRYVHEAFALEYYQTMFARVPGSAEMPSAGRPFTPRVLSEVRRRGANVAVLTLHTGVSSQEAHEAPYAEPYVVPAATARAVNETRARGGRVIAVGTTVVRALESAMRDDEVVAAQGMTDLVVTRERGLHAVDALLTGLHEAQASHLRLLEALVPDEVLDRAYGAALDAGLLWHEFGDVHLIL